MSRRTEQRERELWLIGIGAALADKSLRPKLVGDPPPDLRPLVEAIQNGNATTGWEALARWGVRKQADEEPTARVLAALDALERLKRRLPLLEQARSALVAGAEEMYQAKMAELERLK